MVDLQIIIKENIKVLIMSLQIKKYKELCGTTVENYDPTWSKSLRVYI